jgi:peptidoglycan hydrolase CwlO-like protein
MTHFTRLENLNKQLMIGEKITVLLDQSSKLMQMVNDNQKELNRLKEETEQLQVHMDNSTDHIEA